MLMLDVDSLEGHLTGCRDGCGGSKILLRLSMQKLMNEFGRPRDLDDWRGVGCDRMQRGFHRKNSYLCVQGRGEADAVRNGILGSFRAIGGDQDMMIHLVPHGSNAMSPKSGNSQLCHIIRADRSLLTP